MTSSASASVPAPLGLTPQALTLDKEKTYFAVVLVFSILVWLGLAITIVGLFYAALFAVFLWIGNGLLVAWLRAEAVRVDERQLPELHAELLKACDKLGITRVPKLYVLQAGGTLNAFATRFSGRDFVVVYSDVLEAFGPSSPEIQFILGHELGHLKSNHILKQLLLAPGLLLPLAGTAYLRACEASCDRHGAFVAESLDGAVSAMMTLSGGKDYGRKLDPVAFAGQHEDERGFFVSLHELTSGYPTLSQRVRALLALRDSQFERAPSRHPLAYIFALFTPGGRVAAGGNVLVFVVVIGLLAAMAIPAFQKVRQASLLKACTNNQRMIEAAYEQATLEAGKAPSTYEEFIGPGKGLAAMPVCPSGGEYSVSAAEDSTCTVECSVHAAGAH